MIQFRCLDCKSVFEAPVAKTYYSDDYGDDTECYCPVCGSDTYEDVVECPGCEGWKKPHELVCISCHTYARRKLSAFARNFSEALREEMNDILNTESLMDLVEG